MHWLLFDSATGEVFLEYHGTRSIEGKQAAKSRREEGRNAYSPATTALLDVLATGGMFLPTSYALASTSHRALSPLTLKARELAAHREWRHVVDLHELEKRCGLTPLFIFLAHPPAGQDSPAGVRLSYAGVKDLAIHIPSLFQKKPFVFDEFLKCKGQPLILRGDPRCLRRADTNAMYFEGDLSKLLDSGNVALVFVSRQERRDEHGGLFAAVDSRGVSLPRWPSRGETTTWVAYKVCGGFVCLREREVQRLVTSTPILTFILGVWVCGLGQVTMPDRESPVNICVEILGLAADGEEPAVLPAHPRSQYQVVLTRERVWVKKDEFDRRWSKPTCIHPIVAASKGRRGSGTLMTVVGVSLRVIFTSAPLFESASLD